MESPTSVQFFFLLYFVGEKVGNKYMNKVAWKRMIYHGKDLGDFYLVSNTGEIKGVKTGKIRKKNISHEGYYFVTVSLGSRKDKRMIKVHRAVAETFLNNPDDFPIINHKDGNKLNNNIKNLEFCTYKYNLIHALSHGLLKSRAKKIKCLNTGVIFCSICDAAQWCNCSDSSIRDYLFYNKNRESAGKHPLTGEKLQWELVL